MLASVVVLCAAVCLAAAAVEQQPGHIVWDFPAGNSVEGKPGVCVLNNATTVYVATYDDFFFGLNGQTGRQIFKRVDIKGMVRSAPAVYVDNNGKTSVFILSGDGNVYAIDGDSGAILWKYATGEPEGQYTSSSPTVLPVGSSAIVYVGSETKNVLALNASTGTLVWAQTTGDRIFSSPTVHYVSPKLTALFIGSDDMYMHAFNALTGAPLWTHQTFDFIRGSAVAWTNSTSGQVLVFFGSNDGTVNCVDGVTGALVWSYSTEGDVYSTPAVFETNGKLSVFVGSYDFNIYGFDGATGSVLWAYKTTDYVIASPAVVASRAGGVGVYVGSNDAYFYAVDAVKGTLLWRKGVENPVWSSAAAISTTAGQAVVFGTQGGDVFALQVDA